MSAFLDARRKRLRAEAKADDVSRTRGDLYQLDAFNFETGAYDIVCTGKDSLALGDKARSLGIKAWRIWNRTKRAARDRMLPPVSAITKTFNHGRRFARVHKSPAKRSTEYENHQV
jgi:hypothetical protein